MKDLRIYCRDCKFMAKPWNPKCRVCNHPKFIKTESSDGPFEHHKETYHSENMDTLNKNNDCKYFEKKRNLTIIILFIIITIIVLYIAYTKVPFGFTPFDFGPPLN